MGAVKNYWHDEICARDDEGENEPDHARIEAGSVVVMSDGHWQANPRLAWSEWLIASQSPIASTQQRAREIRAALLATGYSERLPE